MVECFVLNDVKP